jgi:prepilin-type N-terminal cleavage/methylation domain-containing protein
MRRHGFTLIELLVVITIIILISAVTLPTLLTGIGDRQMSESARILQAALAGARDAAIRDNSPSGIRLLADPLLPLTSSQIIPLAMPPAYQDGLVSIYPTQAYTAGVMLGTSALVLEELPGSWVQDPKTGIWAWVPNSPTSWFWNVRVGDKVQINNAGPWYTVCGPVVTANAEQFVGVGDPGTTSPVSRVFTSPDGQTVTRTLDYLLLVNGKDDNANGWVDEGFDGVDNNANNTTDESAEWEPETWLGVLASQNTIGASYAIRRRPAPANAARTTVLPQSVVVDLRTNRSRLPVNQTTGNVDIIVNPDGTVVPTTIYSTPSSIGLSSGVLFFWLGNRADVGAVPTNSSWLVALFSKTGQVSSSENSSPTGDFARMMQGN